MVKKISLALGALVLLALASFYVFKAQISSMLFERGLAERMADTNDIGAEDGLHLGLCGTGSPMPSANRAGPCNVIIAGDKIYVVDTGEGASRNLTMMGINTSAITGVLLTHFHSDHIDGMGPMMLLHWVRDGNTAPLKVFGPKGLEAVVDGFNAAYETDGGYRTAHHGTTVAPTTGGGAEAIPFEMTSDVIEVIKDGDLTITAFNVLHTPVSPAVGYRFDYKGRSLCISGDTMQTAKLEKACAGVDIVVHDSLQPRMIEKMRDEMEARGNTIATKIFGDIIDYHASPEQAAESAQRAKAKMLVLSHLVPPVPNPVLYTAFLGDAPDKFDGPVVVGEDGMLFSMPAGSDKIERRKLL